MGQEQSKAKPVIELRGDSPVYRKEVVTEMIRNGPAKGDTKVFIICISGVYRSGKSFFLNLLKTYLDYYSEHKCDAGWRRSHDMEIKGGNWAQGEDSVTHGIWMYMYPDLIDNRAIILMDCQGNMDIMKSTPTLDNLILILGLQLADVHILNIDRTLGADDLDRLGLCVYHADDDSGGSIFERQIFLIRNWGNAEKPKQLDQLIANRKSVSVRKAALGIQRAFRKVEVTSLPYPGRGIAGRSEANEITLGDISDQFLQDVRELFYRLILRLSIEARMNGQEFLDRFEFVCNRAVGKISTPQQAYEESLIKEVFNDRSTHFAAKMEKLKSMTRQLTAPQMEAKVTAIYQETLTKFNNHKRVKSCENPSIATDYLGYLEKEYKEAIVLMGQMVEEERLNATIEQMKKDDQVAKAKLRSIEGEYERSKQKIQKLKTACDNARTFIDLQIAKEALAAEQGVADQKERLRNEAMKRYGLA